MRVEKVKTFNWESAIQGMRNPMKSWERSDSSYNENGEYTLGHNDFELAMKLIKGGSEHRKFLRQIFISFNLIAPDYFFKEFDTYRIGVIENSTSTMHTLTKERLTIDNFEWDHSSDPRMIVNIINHLNSLRDHYEEATDESAKKLIWREIIQLLPMSFLYHRTVSINYEVLFNMYHQRRTHKLKEWHIFLDAILESIPYSQFILTKKI